MPNVLTWLLLPFSWLYAAVLGVRNWLYDSGWKKSESFAVPLIGVGNLRVGGTGKTPHVVWVVEELLRQGHRPAILSRGYGRRTRGPRLATASDSAATVGDEPWQYFQQFGAQNVPVAVAEARRLGAQRLLQQHPKITVIVLDDAYQHRAVRLALNVLLTELSQPFYDDAVLPVGRLRESRRGARRADVVLVTKCLPGLSAAEQQWIAQCVRRYSRPAVPVLFSAYAYATPEQMTNEMPRLGPPGGPALLLTGIARPEPLRQYLVGQGYELTFHAKFPDHHAFRPVDFAALRAHWQPGWPIFTTSKDATRLQAPELRTVLAGLPLYTIPVQVAFLAGGAGQLRQLLAAAVGSNSPLSVSK